MSQEWFVFVLVFMLFTLILLVNSIVILYLIVTLFSYYSTYI